MPLFEIAALAAALCWALSSLISVGPSQSLGAVRFNHLRQCIVFTILAAYVFAAGGWQTLTLENAVPLVISGAIGIFLGDTALFLTMNRLGPRRSGILFSLNAPVSAVLGWLFLGETLKASTQAGIAIASIGVILAIVFGKRRSQLHQWENIKGPLWIGVTLGLAAALSQAVGSLIARPIMAAGADPAAASMLRIGVAALCLTVVIALPGKALISPKPLTMQVAGMVALSGFLAMAVGMTLILFALSGGKVGIVSTLSATTPALVLPLLWLKTKERPAPGAWFGAALVIIGSALIFAR